MPTSKEIIKLAREKYTILSGDVYKPYISWKDFYTGFLEGYMAAMLPTENTTRQIRPGESTPNCLCGTGRGAIWCQVHECYTGGLVE